jgi:predicted ATPase with chaperone activity
MRYESILRVTRTIADFPGENPVTAPIISEAIRYPCFTRAIWRQCTGRC